MLTILINPVVVTLQFAQPKKEYPYFQYGQVLAVNGNEELAKFTITPISKSQIKLFMEDVKSDTLYESIIDKDDYSNLEEPIQVMLNKINLTL